MNEIYIELIVRNENTTNAFEICNCAIRDLDVVIPIDEIVVYLHTRKIKPPSEYNLTMREIFN